MKEKQMTYEEKVERIMKINDTLKEAGMDWKQIDRFWAKIFLEAKQKNREIQEPTI